MITGYIHSVDTFGTVDDGGIRFVIFMQGCVMRCKFCHNPDTWLSKGRPVTVQEMMDKIRDYKVFFDISGGGVTVSGGEPLLQHTFVAELFDECGKAGIHRTVDTSGYCKHGDFSSILLRSDRILFSIKVVNRAKHESLTSVDNDRILDNLRSAAQSEAELIIRYVLIPRINDSPEDLDDVIVLVKGLNKNLQVDVLPYHRMGIAKWDQLGMNYALRDIPEPTQDEIERVRKMFETADINLVEYS